MFMLDATFFDLEPLPQDDGPVPVVRIAYPDGFEEVMSYFRRVVVTGECSQRTLQLSAEVIAHNAANYTAWQYRRRCLEAMHSGSSNAAREQAWREELAFCTARGRENLKNYQVWFHRRSCLARLDSGPEAELEFVAEILRDDSKNYHAWGHRQWVLSSCGGWEGEAAFVEGLLEEDARNNSAWNQRYFLLQHTADLSSLSVAEGEVDFAARYIAAAPGNPSPWNYLRGVVEPLGYSAVPRVRLLCEGLLAGDAASGAGRVAAMSLLVDVLDEGGDPAEQERARSLCDSLEDLDSLREAYWQWRRSRVGAQQPTSPDAQ